MFSPNIHPDIQARHDRLLKDFDTLFDAIDKMQTDLISMTKRAMPIIQQMMDFESHMIHLLEKEKVPPSMLKKQTQVSVDAREHGFKLFWTLPKLCKDDNLSLESICEFQLHLYDRLDELPAVQHDKKRSEAIITKLEKKLQTQQEHYNKARINFNDCNRALDQLQAIFNSLLN